LPSIAIPAQLVADCPQAGLVLDSVRGIRKGAIPNHTACGRSGGRQQCGFAKTKVAGILITLVSLRHLRAGTNPISNSAKTSAQRFSRGILILSATKRRKQQASLGRLIAAPELPLSECPPHGNRPPGRLAGQSGRAVAGIGNARKQRTDLLLEGVLGASWATIPSKGAAKIAIRSTH